MKRAGITFALMVTIAVAAVGAGPSGPAQRPVPPPPDNLTRIREAVNREPVLKVENGQLRIYVEVIAKWPSFAEIAKGYDLKNGPARANAISHGELFSTTAPKNLYGSGGIQAGEILTMAIVNYVGQAAIIKGLQAISKRRSAKELADIRAQIDRELAAIKGGK